MLDQPQIQRDSGSVSAMAVWWPVVGASLVIAALSIAVSAVRMFQTYPHDPWESIIIADAYRASVGLPVYTDPESETGHATHIYGPLMIYTVGLLFKLTGISRIAAQVVPLVATIWVIAAFAVIYFRRLPWIATIAGIAMLMSLNARLQGLFTQIHPDMPALGFSILALILMFQAMERRRWACLPLALGSFCVAYLFKQTFAMFTIVPFLSLLLRRKWSIGTVLAAAAPPAAIIGLIIALSVIAPYVHFHMIIAVSRWSMRFDVLAISPLRFISFYILLPVALSIMILIPGITFSDPKIRWLISGGVAGLGGFLQYSKVGGGEGAFVPAVMSLMVLSTLGIAAAWETTSASLISPARARVFACLIALVMMVDGVTTSKESLRAMFVAGHGDQHYPQVVDYVRNLKGRVVCPDDPTIPIVALGQTGRSYWAESDSHFLSPLPALTREILRADYVIVVNPQATTCTIPDMLDDLGFVPASWGGTNMGIYELWRKRQTGAGDNGSRLN